MSPTLRARSLPSEPPAEYNMPMERWSFPGSGVAYAGDIGGAGWVPGTGGETARFNILEESHGQSLVNIVHSVSKESDTIEKTQHMWKI